MNIYHFISIFNHIWIFLFKRTLTSFNFFFSLTKTHIIHLIQVVPILITFQKFCCFIIHGTDFFGFTHLYFINHIVNNSLVFLFLWNIILGIRLLPRSLVGWAAAYLVPNSPKTLHSSEECSSPWIIQVFDSLFERSTYCLRRLQALPSFAGWVFGEASSPLSLLLIPVRLASAWIVF